MSNIYPIFIPTSGPLSLSVLFQWWKDALKANDYDEGFDPSWRDLILPDFPPFPMTRQSFYAWVDRWYAKPDGLSSLYSYSDVVDGWFESFAIYWGRIKTWEMAIFGNVANGGRLFDVSLLKYNINDTGTMGVDKWTHCNLKYLRYAFNRFSDYGSCVVKSDEGDDDNIVLVETVVPSAECVLSFVDPPYYSVDITAHVTGYPTINPITIQVNFVVVFLDASKNYVSIPVTINAGFDYGTAVFSSDDPVMASFIEDVEVAGASVISYTSTSGVPVSVRIKEPLI